MAQHEQRKPEIIAIASGKGGTGKTLLTASLGYALIRAGHRVLLIDADLGTDGLSLFVLGPEGRSSVKSFEEGQVLVDLLQNPSTIEHFKPRTIHRNVGAAQHGVSYACLVASRQLYADGSGAMDRETLHTLTQEAFRRNLGAIFDKLRAFSPPLDYDYVIVDTRGGFSAQSADACALADSFVIVMEADYTSFYQQRSLLVAVEKAAQELSTRPALRAVVVNKSIDGEENLFRSKIAETFPLEFQQTYAIPLDPDAARAYKTQELPFVLKPGSAFAYAALRAFSGILGIVTAEWPTQRIDAWNGLVSQISRARSAMERQTKARQVFRALTSIGFGLSLCALVYLTFMHRASARAEHAIELQNDQVTKLRNDLRAKTDALQLQTQTLLESQSKLSELNQQERAFANDVEALNAQLAALKPSSERAKTLEWSLAAANQRLKSVQRAQADLDTQNTNLVTENGRLKALAKDSADRLDGQHAQILGLSATTDTQRAQLDQLATSVRELSDRHNQDAAEVARLLDRTTSLSSNLSDCFARLDVANKLRENLPPPSSGKPGAAAQQLASAFQDIVPGTWSIEKWTDSSGGSYTGTLSVGNQTRAGEFSGTFDLKSEKGGSEKVRVLVTRKGTRIHFETLETQDWAADLLDLDLKGDRLMGTGKDKQGKSEQMVLRKIR